MKEDERDLITSPQNSRIKELVRLEKKREREKSGLILIEGARELSLALEAGAGIKEVFFNADAAGGDEENKLLERLRGAAIPLTGVSARAFEKIAYREGTSAMVAVAKRPERRLENLPRGKTPLYLVIDAVEKPGNLGAMLRSADAAGATGIIVSDMRADIWSPNAVRASIGTIFALPIAAAPAGRAITWLKKHGVSIVTATPGADTLYTEVDLAAATAVVVGSEDAGAGPAWLTAADVAVRIPMLGKGDSLNVSAAATILLYEALRQRTKSRQ